MLKAINVQGVIVSMIIHVDTKVLNIGLVIPSRKERSISSNGINRMILIIDVSSVLVCNTDLLLLPLFRQFETSMQAKVFAFFHVIDYHTYLCENNLPFYKKK